MGLVTPKSSPCRHFMSGKEETVAALAKKPITPCARWGQDASQMSYSSPKETFRIGLILDAVEAVKWGH